MATLLVIGGSGFFGKSILDCYRRGQLSFWNIDSLIVMARNAEKLKALNPELINSSVMLFNGDISKCSVIPEADYVIHAAASTDAANYLSRPLVEKQNIQAGTYNYCELAKKFHRNSRIIYCSSGAIYGQQPLNVECLPEEYVGGSINELTPIKIDYATAKRDAENAIINLGKDGLSVSIARCFAFIGKYLPRDQHFAIGNFIEDGLSKRSINVKANNPVYRSYMHADDLVRWLMTICASANPSCPIYNVGSDEAIEIRQLAELIAEYFGVTVNKVSMSHEQVDRYVPCTSKARHDLSLMTSIDLKSAIYKTTQDFRVNKKHA